ncbi:MAG: four helix bundle protein [Polyangiaceae bacterium]
MQEKIGLGFGFMRLDVYRVARELVAEVVRAEIGDGELRDQATRAAKSAFLNLCEGLPSNSGPMRRKFFASARGSAAEVASALDLASVLGVVTAERAERVISLAARLSIMLARL